MKHGVGKALAIVKNINKAECTDVEKAIKFFDEEIERLERAPIINGCEMTDDWKEQLEICKLAKSALEKHIPKKPVESIHKYIDSVTKKHGGYRLTHCPRCWDNKQLKYFSTLVDKHILYCHRCGQALDWSDTE